jgi:hypothetical protein
MDTITRIKPLTWETLFGGNETATSPFFTFSVCNGVVMVNPVEGRPYVKQLSCKDNQEGKELAETLHNKSIVLTIQGKDPYTLWDELT